jgi:predicted TIM-barrel enzyme
MIKSSLPNLKDGIVFENMHDRPYQLGDAGVGPETVAAMTRLCTDAVRVLGPDRHRLLLGLQVLAGANQSALAVAQAAGIISIK